MQTTTTIDPRIAAEAKLYNLASHAMHHKASNEASNQPHSWLYSQWNADFTGWERTAEYRRLDVQPMGRSQHVRYNRDGSIRELINR